MKPLQIMFWSKGPNKKKENRLERSFNNKWCDGCSQLSFDQAKMLVYGLNNYALPIVNSVLVN